MKKLLLTIISSLALGGMATAQQTDAAVAAADTQPRKIISQQPDGELKEYYRHKHGLLQQFWHAHARGRGRLCGQGGV